MSRLWSPFVRQLDPYIPGEQPSDSGITKLNTNENPYPPSPQVQKVLGGFLGDTLRLYPDPESSDLTEVIAQYHDVQAKNVFVGNGSDEVLAHAFNAFFRQADSVIFPDITYSFYSVYCRLYNIDFITLPLDANFELDICQYERDNGGIIFANPNAPTGIFSALGGIEQLLENNQHSVVIVDEAYIDFVNSKAVEQVSAIALTSRFKNLLVTRTLSKSRSLAGLRLGYAIGGEDLIEGLQRVKNSFNSYPIDSLASTVAIASFKDEAYFEATRLRVIENRDAVVLGLNQLGFECLPSATNFVFARHKLEASATIFSALRKKGIIVRYFDKPRINEYLRISVGATQENERLLSALKEILL